MAEKVTFTLVTNKKHKRKNKAPPLSSISFFDSKNKTLLISRVFPLPKTITSLSVLKLVTTHSGSTMTSSPATITSKTVQVQITPSFIFLASKPKLKAKLFAQAVKDNIN